MDKEYIPREDVINDIGELFTICRETYPNECGHHFIVEDELQIHLDHMRNLPAADVVEVVRCRECKHSIMHKFPYNYEKVLACNDPHGVTIRAVKPMHFCSYGERKDGGQEPPKEEA